MTAHARKLGDGASAASSTALTFSPSAGPQRIIPFAVVQEGATSEPSGDITFGGVSIKSQVAHSVYLDDTVDLRIDVYYATEADIAAGTGSNFALSGAAAETTLHAETWCQASQAIPIGNTASNTVSGASPNPVTCSLTCAAGAGAFSAAAVGNTGLSSAWESDLTEITEVSDASHTSSAASELIVSGGAKTCGTTWSGGTQNRAVVVAFEIQAFGQTGDNAFGNKVNDKWIFSLTGTWDFDTLDAGSINTKAWGTGGGGGLTSVGTGGAGGASGYAAETQSIGSQESWKVEVGVGGVASGSATASSGGGDLTGIYVGSRTEANFNSIPGSGGAGGNGSSFSISNTGGAGGAGGGTTGANGTAGAGSSGGDFGDGATASAGGAGGSGGSGADGSAGSALTGGAGGSGSFPAGGSGGDGRYGGGGGEGSFNSTDSGGGGGGGSGKVTGSSTTLTQGTGTTPPNTGDGDYISGRGVGGAASTDGGDGLIIIEIAALATAAPPPFRALLGVGF